MSEYCGIFCLKNITHFECFFEMLSIKYTNLQIELLLNLNLHIMKKLLPILLLTIFFFPATAQDTIRHLIFTEWRGDGMTNAYTELTNVGNVPVDLSKFTLATITPHLIYPIADQRHQKRLEGSLQPGESYVIMTVYEGTSGTGRPIHRTQMLPIADLKVYVIEGGVENDSVSYYDRLLRLFNGVYCSVLWYNLESGDSVIVDAVANDINVVTGQHTFLPSSVAGFENATETHILVRKANVTRGNPNWDNARGVSLEDSEWLPVLHDGTNPDGSIYTTVGVHGNYSISFESQIVGINMTDTILTVPWGVLKGDSLVADISLGPNMAWRYHESIASDDSAYNTARSGDKLSLYAFGNQIQQMDFKIAVSEPATNMVNIFPLRNRNFTTRAWTQISRYYVTKNAPVIDTIGNVPFATRVDTLLAYLSKAPQATWEIVWVDGAMRVDLKNGDILKVTAQDGSTTKEYFIDVLDFVPSSNASLSAITWPDMPGFIEGWIEDTIPFFASNRFSYNVELPFGSTNIPALLASTQSLNAVVTEKRAVSLKGSVADRTTVFTVTAQDDSTILVYSVLFDVEKLDAKQVFRAEPFFSQIIHSHRNQNSFLEITNPGNVPLSLDEYLVVRSIVAGSPADALQQYLANIEQNWTQRYNKYVPGFRFQSLEDWVVKPGLLVFDPAISPTLNPGEVFVIGRLHTNPDRRPAEENQVDIHFSNNLANVWGEVGFSHNAVSWVRHFSAHYLFRIENDSVLEGNKPVGDPADYTLIDMFGNSTAENMVVAGMPVAEDGWNFIRKPHIWKGNPESMGSWGTNAEDSEWNVIKWGGSGTPWEPISEGLGTHAMDPATVYISTVSSLSYLVSDGFDGLQSIQGDLSGKTLQTFYELINKADTGQVFTMKSNVDGSVKTAEEMVVGNDTLIVVSADGNNSTSYLLVNDPIDNDAVLTAKEGSGYNVSITGNTGSISGMNFGSTLEDVLENVIKPQTAILNIIDDNSHLVPLRILNYENVYVDTKIGDSYFFEVIAQDGVTIITYKLSPEALSSDAFVISSVYEVNQETLIISKIPFGTSVAAFFERIEAAGNASTQLTDKLGIERQQGTLSYDDKLTVRSEDLSTTVTYHIDFIGELNPDRAALTGIIGYKPGSSEALLVYPNPTSERFYLKGLSKGEVIYITDIMGRTLQISRSEDLIDGISLSGQPTGIYMVIAVDRDNNIRRAKLIKR